MQWIWIGLGGFAGAIGRYALAKYVPAVGTWPWGTFVANALGSLLLGLFAGLLLRGPDTPGAAYLFLGVGFCGSLTTFSTFSLELVRQLQGGAWPTAVLYLAASVAAGVVAVLAGLRLAG